MYNIIEIIFRNLIKREIINISTMKENFFIYKKLDKKIKLSQEIIKINYSSESPFLVNETNITSVSEENYLYLWFSKKTESQRYLPESLLLFRHLVKTHQNAICIFKGDVYRILIIKNSILKASFVKRNITENDLLLMKDEYFLDTEIIFDKDEYDSFLKKSYKYLLSNDLLSILNIQLDFKSTLNSIIQWSALPLLISSIILTGFIAGYDFYQKSENEKLFNIFKDSAKLTSEIKNSVNKNEELSEVFSSLDNEFKYINKSLAISKILKISEDLNMTLEFIRIDDARVQFVFLTLKEERIPIYTTKLFESQLFSDIKNISSKKIRNIITRATMQAKLKER